MFTQSDVTFVTRVHNELSSSALGWTPDGQIAAVSEDTSTRHNSGYDDLVVNFLDMAPEKLSSGDDGAVSRSFTDDESNIEAFLGGTLGRRQSRAASTRSSKSQANTPPSADGRPIVDTLDESIAEQGDIFGNHQIALRGSVHGLSSERETVSFLARFYASPSTENERRQSPEMILERLEAAFMQNAHACEMVSMHRVAQTWRVLCAVIVPELKDCADKNRVERRANATKAKAHLKSNGTRVFDNGLSPLAGLPARRRNSNAEAKSEKVVGNLLKGVLEADKTYGRHCFSDKETASNMTTPLAKPLPDSPASPSRQQGSRFARIEEAFEPMPPLPPSVLTAHSTAETASRALLSDSMNTSHLPLSPSQPRLTHHSSRTQQGRSRTETSDVSQPSDNIFNAARQEPQASQRNQKLQASNVQTQEHRRAALRDYQAQPRPVFTLEESLSHSRPVLGERHDSAESFPMFSASTDSSHKARSLGQSFASSTIYGLRGQFEGPSPEQPGSNESELQLSPVHVIDRYKSTEFKDNKIHEHVSSLSSALGLDGSMDFGFDHDVSSFSEPKPPKPITIADPCAITENVFQTNLPLSETAVSSEPDIFTFDLERSLPKPHVHLFNPILQAVSGQKIYEEGKKTDMLTEDGEDLASAHYSYNDFRPINPSTYVPRQPFAWSALPLICHSIAFDNENGIAASQFSAHLLMHVHPFFFHQKNRTCHTTDEEISVTMASMLLRPDMSHRVIEQLLQAHCSYLGGMMLFESMAEVRKMCVEFDYPGVCGIDTDAELGSTLHPSEKSVVITSCACCHAPISKGNHACLQCGSTRQPCPICLSMSLQDHQDGSASTHGPTYRLWLYCHICGHGGHLACMEGWLAQPDSEGICPSLGCGCDCGPGTIRQQRVEIQVQEDEDSRAVSRPAVAVAKKDPVKIDPSPATDRARNMLRTTNGERGTQSGDERLLSSSRRGGSRSSMSGAGPSGFGSQRERKSVRLVTPREEGDQLSDLQ